MRAQHPHGVGIGRTGGVAGLQKPGAIARPHRLEQRLPAVSGLHLLDRPKGQINGLHPCTFAKNCSGKTSVGGVGDMHS